MSRFNPEWLNIPRKRGSPENHLVLQILHYLKAVGLVAGKVKVKGSFSKRGAFILDPYLMTGLPDIFAFDEKNKVMYGIEAKIKGNTQSANQRSFQELFHNPPGRIYLVAYSLEDVKKGLS